MANGFLWEKNAWDVEHDFKGIVVRENVCLGIFRGILYCTEYWCSTRYFGMHALIIWLSSPVVIWWERDDEIQPQPFMTLRGPRRVFPFPTFQDALGCYKVITQLRYMVRNTWFDLKMIPIYFLLILNKFFVVWYNRVIN